jgi:hypothetical protein
LLQKVRKRSIRAQKDGAGLFAKTLRLLWKHIRKSVIHEPLL